MKCIDCRFYIDKMCSQGGDDSEPAMDINCAEAGDDVLEGGTVKSHLPDGGKEI